MGFPKVQSCFDLSEGLSDKQTVSLAEEDIYVSGMDLRKGAVSL